MAVNGRETVNGGGFVRAIADETKGILYFYIIFFVLRLTFTPARNESNARNCFQLSLRTKHNPCARVRYETETETDHARIVSKPRVNGVRNDCVF